MHVVERKDERGSEEPAGAGGGAVVSEGSEAMTFTGRSLRFGDQKFP